MFLGANMVSVDRGTLEWFLAQETYAQFCYTEPNNKVFKNITSSQRENHVPMSLASVLVKDICAVKSSG